MKEIIAIKQSSIGAYQVNTINARDLHSFLGVGKDFSNWIKKQIERARLLENRDFIVFTQKGENLEGGRPATEYHLTLEAGKHIAMLSGAEKGFEVREYFIECEKRALAPTKALPTNYKEALLQLVEQVEHNEQLQIELTTKEAKIEADRPQIEAFSRIAKSEGTFNLTSSAKLIHIKPCTLIDYLSENKWIYKRAGSKHWVAYQQRIEQGFMRHKSFNYIDKFGFAQTGEQVVVTAKGLACLGEIFASQPRQHVSGDKRNGNPKQQSFIN